MTGNGQRVPTCRDRGRREVAPRAFMVLLLSVASSAAIGCRGSSDGATGDGGGGGRASSVSQIPREKPAVGPWFVDRAEEFGLDVVTRSGDPAKPCVLDAIGTGVALLDFDGDDDLDLLVLNGSEVRDGAVRSTGGPWLFRNDGPGRWVDVTESSGLRATGWAQGVAVADYDADGLPDLIVVQHGQDTLWRNAGDGTFEDVTEAAGIEDRSWGVSATWGDVDGDGWPDLYVTNYLEVDPLDPPPPNDYLPGVPVFQGPVTLPGQRDRLWRNRGDGTFEDVTEAAGLLREPNKGMSALLADLDEDGRLDLYVTNDTHANELFRGVGGGRFEEIGVAAGVAFNGYGVAEGSMAVDLADLDGDGRLDLAISNFRQEGTRVYANIGNHSYVDRSGDLSLWDHTAGFVGWGLVLADLDLDGWSDLFQVNGHVYPNVNDSHYHQPPIALRSRHGRSLEDVTESWGPALPTLQSGRGLAMGDLDNDGDLDLVMTSMDGPLRVLINEGDRDGAAVTVRLIGRRPNVEAIGARVTVEAGGRSRVAVVRRGGSILSASDVRLSFGLGEATTIDGLRVRWPDGTEDHFPTPPVESILTIRQDGPSLDSVPFRDLNR